MADKVKTGTVLSDQTRAFHEKAKAAINELFALARKTNELQYAFSLMPEFRGMQGPGWSTATEAQVAFEEYLAFVSEGELTPLRARVSLAFYCHIAEAAGFYEIPKNMLRVASGGVYWLWPFQDLVKQHRMTGNLIAPNANKVLKDLAGHSKELGLDALAEVFRDAFDSELRNGYAHADYIIWDDGVRLRNRNGGNAKVVSWPDYQEKFNRGIGFFRILQTVVEDHLMEFVEERTLGGTWGDGRQSRAVAKYDPKTGSFSISDSSPI